jgi:hypothetical protein
MVCVGPVVLMGLTFFGRVRSNGSCSGVRCTYHPAPCRNRNSAGPSGTPIMLLAARPPCASARIQRPPRRARSIFHDRVPRLRTPGQPERIIRRSSRSSRLDPGRRRTTTTARSGPRGAPYAFATLQVFVCLLPPHLPLSAMQQAVTQSEGAPLRLSAMTGRQRQS